jgi:hypothetical protein
VIIKHRINVSGWAGKDTIHIWMAFKAWRGEDAEGYFGALGNWAEGRLKDMDIFFVIQGELQK